MIKSKINKKNSELFDQYLSDYQQDIKNIVGKYRKSHHILSNDEICSECNMYLIKKKDKILESFNEKYIFSQSEFNKIAFHYAKNSVIWTHGSLSRKGYHAKRVDFTANTDEGLKTSFEIEVENRGIENKDIDNDQLFLSQNIENFIHILTEHSYMLTAQESTILALLKNGLNQYQIADELNVTHQAISIRCIELQKKIQDRFDLNEVMQGGSIKSISKGMQSIEAFFQNKKSPPRVTEEDKLLLKGHILANPYTYNISKLNKLLFNNKYTNHKVAGAIKSLKLNYLIVSSSRPIPIPTAKKILNLFEKKKSIKQVSRLLDLPITTVRRMRAKFVIEGKLEKLNQR